MAGAGGKGRISNELVAASCAAVLAVYAAGYWRTREDARRVDVRTQERRSPRPAPAPAPEPLQIPAPPPVAVTESARSLPSVSLQPEVPVASAAKDTAAVSSHTAATDTPPAAPPTTEPGLPAVVASATQPAPQVAAPTVAAAATLATPSGTWRDGTYTGWGTSRHGDIKAQVVIREGRIVDASIASCETRYPCDVIGDIIHQPVDRQNPDVDRVTRATESADAYYWGLVEALKEAQVPAAESAAAAAPR